MLSFRIVFFKLAILTPFMSLHISSQLLSFSPLGSIFDGLQSLLSLICHRQIDAFSRNSLTGLTPPFSMSSTSLKSSVYPRDSCYLS
jgi:hypothetical protein